MKLRHQTVLPDFVISFKLNKQREINNDNNNNATYVINVSTYYGRRLQVAFTSEFCPLGLRAVPRLHLPQPALRRPVAPAGGRLQGEPDGRVA